LPTVIQCLLYLLYFTYEQGVTTEARDSGGGINCRVSLLTGTSHWRLPLCSHTVNWTLVHVTDLRLRLPTYSIHLIYSQHRHKHILINTLTFTVH